ATRCPWWIGSNVPPMIPSRRFCVMTTRISSAARARDDGPESDQAGQRRVAVLPGDDADGLADLDPRHGPAGQDADLGGQPERLAEAVAERVAGVARHRLAGDDEADGRAAAVDDELVVRPDEPGAEQDALHLAGIHVDAPHDDHVVDAAEHLAHPDQGPSAGA